MANEMSSSAWVLMEDDCNCGEAPPFFHLPPPPIPPDLPCELMDMSCPSLLNVSDAEFKRIGSFPSITVIVCCTLLSAVILLVIAGIVWRKKRKSVTQTKDFDSHHGPTMMNGNGNGILYEDLAHARARPPIAPPSIEMLDVNHHNLSNTNGMLGNPKLDFSYFLNGSVPPPIYEELPDHSSDHHNNGPSEDEFAEDELSVIDVPISHTHESDSSNPASRYHNSMARPSNKPHKSASLTRKRPSRNSSSSGGFKSQRSLDRRSRNNGFNSNKYPGTNPRQVGVGGPGTMPRQFVSMDNNTGSMLILSNHNGMTMKIPPHLVAVLTESALCNGGAARPYEILPTTSHHPAGMVNNGSIVNGSQPGMYPSSNNPSSRSSGSSYGDGSSSGSRNNPVNSIESSFDSGIGPHSIASFLNSPAYDQTVLPPSYPLNAYEYSTATGVNPPQYNMVPQHPSFRRLRMTAVDSNHPLYSNHLLT